MFPDALIARAKKLLKACEKQGVMIAMAESCTGGLIAALLTEIPGSSRVVERGFVTYSDEAKNELLVVPAALIRKHGAVSEPVVKAMAEGALRHSHAQLSVAVTGIAGPDGGSEEKPVGLVYIAVAFKGNIIAEECRFKGDREAVRLGAVEKAIAMLLKAVSD